MLNALQWSFWVVGLGLQALLLLRLCKGGAKEFPVLLAYILCLLVTTVVDIIGYVSLGKKSETYRQIYWSAELIRQSALLTLVVSLAIHALPPGRRTDSYTRILIVAAGAVWMGSMALFYVPDLNNWMTAVARNLSFFTGVLNLLVWFAYVRGEVRDPTRLLIAAGLGLQMSGEAIGQATRLLDMVRSVRLGGSIFIVVTHLLCLFIWWRAIATSGTTVLEQPKFSPIEGANAGKA